MQVPQIRRLGARHLRFCPARGWGGDGIPRNIQDVPHWVPLWTPVGPRSPGDVKIEEHNAKGALVLLDPLPAGERGHPVSVGVGPDPVRCPCRIHAGGTDQGT